MEILLFFYCHWKNKTWMTKCVIFFWKMCHFCRMCHFLLKNVSFSSIVSSFWLNVSLCHATSNCVILTQNVSIWQPCFDRHSSSSAITAEPELVRSEAYNLISSLRSLLGCFTTKDGRIPLRPVSVTLCFVNRNSGDYISGSTNGRKMETR